MTIETICIMKYNFVSGGLWNTFVAKESASEKEMTDNMMPKVNSKSNPETKTLFILLVLLSDRYWAKCFIMAEFIPKSLNRLNNVGDMKAMVYNPYSPSVSSLATRTIPTANIIVERLTPRKMFNPPLADSFAILIALLNNQYSQHTSFQLIHKPVVHLKTIIAEILWHLSITRLQQL